MLRNVKFVRVMLPYHGLGQMSRSTVLFVHHHGSGGPGDKDSDIYETGPVRVRQSIMLLVQSAREAPVMRTACPDRVQ